LSKFTINTAVMNVCWSRQIQHVHCVPQAVSPVFAAQPSEPRHLLSKCLSVYSYRI